MATFPPAAALNIVPLSPPTMLPASAPIREDKAESVCRWPSPACGGRGEPIALHLGQQAAKNRAAKELCAFDRSRLRQSSEFPPNDDATTEDRMKSDEPNMAYT